MSGILHQFDKAFENRVRLGIMAVLAANDQADFNHLKQLLGASDGNLASHLQALENKKMVTATKQFLGKKPNTTYAITPLGRQAFEQHVQALSALLGAGH